MECSCENRKPRNSDFFAIRDTVPILVIYFLLFYPNKVNRMRTLSAGPLSLQNLNFKKVVQIESVDNLFITYSNRGDTLSLILLSTGLAHQCNNVVCLEEFLHSLHYSEVKKAFWVLGLLKETLQLK